MASKQWGLWDSYSDYGVAIKEKKRLKMQGHSVKITERQGKYRLWVKFRKVGK